MENRSKAKSDRSLIASVRLLPVILCFSLAALCALFIATPSQSAAAAAPEASVEIDASKVEGRISPMLYGQFAEFMFEDIKGGLYAELIRDRSFEERPNAIGLPRHWERYPDDRDDDYGIAFRWDDSVAYPVSTALLDPAPAQHALRVDAGAGVVERHGVYQPRVPVRAGATYRGSLWLKTTGYDGRVVAALEQDVVGGPAYAEAEVRDVRGDWRRYDFVLRPARSDALARFAILFYGRGRVWVDQVSLMPGDAVGGVRADVVERVAALRPSFIR
jgi:hypothetical protein